MWTGGAANRHWYRERQLDGHEADEVRKVLAKWRSEKGWQPGMAWNPYRGAYEMPEKSFGPER